MRHQRNLISSTFCIFWFLAAFIMFVERLELHKLVGFDLCIIELVQKKIDNVHTRWMKVFTFLGSPTCISAFVAIASVMFYRRGLKQEALGMLAANATGSGFNEGLKYLFRRRRPDIHRIVPAHGYSFPSGHSMGSVMFYGTLSYFICRHSTSLIGKFLVGAFSTFMVGMTGLSRIYLGVHYPSDVFAGYAAGGTWLNSSIKALNTLLPRRTNGALFKRTK
ncbi:phosphatase PAP2 family protein [Alicyclobacillus fodiniaquatilis]|uniref:Phosphatase PAP2 family protein n=1 Tax=Alicyclobacillus fodiniaquatilis TaxID=1661150 RepID=A0ABW4JEX6_9BACL